MNNNNKISIPNLPYNTFLYMANFSCQSQTQYIKTKAYKSINNRYITISAGYWPWNCFHQNFSTISKSMWWMNLWWSTQPSISIRNQSGLGEYVAVRQLKSKWAISINIFIFYFVASVTNIIEYYCSHSYFGPFFNLLIHK